MLTFTLETSQDCAGAIPELAEALAALGASSESTPGNLLARAGHITTTRGEIATPAFMPVATTGTVKGITSQHLRDLDAQIVLANTFHLASRPGLDVLEAHGGLHEFMRWDRPILTDSGGYQVFSLAELRSIDDDGVSFRDPRSGEQVRLSPESVIDAQRIIGSDIITQLDECAPWPCTAEQAASAVERSLAWAERSRARLDATADRDPDDRQSLYAIVQGSVFPELRRRSATALAALGFAGHAIGGLSVGEGRQRMLTALAQTLVHLPADRPRYLMGVGYPEDLLLAVALGVDQFDCVIPTRNARNAMAFTSTGRLRMRNAAHTLSRLPLDESCDCATCTQGYSRGYIRHLVLAGEYTAHTLLTIHNVRFYVSLMERARAAIVAGRYAEFVHDSLAAWSPPADAPSDSRDR